MDLHCIASHLCYAGCILPRIRLIDLHLAFLQFIACCNQRQYVAVFIFTSQGIYSIMLLYSGECKFYQAREATSKRFRVSSAMRPLLGMAKRREVRAACCFEMPTA